MSFSLPNPTVPTNGQPLDATPVLQNILALAQAIQAFDGSQIDSKSIIEDALADVINPRLRADETIFDHVASGCVWAADSAGASLNGSMTSGTDSLNVVYINGYRVVLSAIVAHAFTANKDTYVDVDYLGNVSYNESANNGASQALAANSIRLAIVVTGATNIAAAASINQGQESRVLPIASSIPYAVTDSLGNLICPRDPSRKVLGYRQLIVSSGPTAAATSDTDISGMSISIIAPGNRKVRLSVFSTGYQQTGGIGTIVGAVKIKEGSTVLTQAIHTPSTANFDVPVNVSNVLTPSPGLHTYKVAIANNSTGPNFTLEAGSTNPMYIMAELE